ncbi:zona pellucida glycoprotein 3-like precursor [Silurus asotus]|uniref:Zona pellucida sperm-binding protein 3 n=1 Tax=Silurus asotus TaxID=30991 RepID=A0AAD5B8S3_SILAS|nr:zona pellucida glycoprotein 3-like precursor [Silurus asotus]
MWKFQTATGPPPEQSERQMDPVPTPSVTSECNETAVHVKVKKNLFENGKPINTAALTLGGCAAKEDTASQVLIYESELNGCNSKLTVTEDELVYVFTLGTASEPLRDNWIFERTSNQYQLGELINIEASVLPFNQVPLRVFVDLCVASAVPDITKIPRYSFIENNGSGVYTLSVRTKPSRVSSFQHVRIPDLTVLIFISVSPCSKKRLSTCSIVIPPALDLLTRLEFQAVNPRCSLQADKPCETQCTVRILAAARKFCRHPKADCSAKSFYIS